MGCAALGLSACKDSKKPEDKPAASAPAPAAAAPSDAMKPAEPAKPAEPEKKSEAPAAAPANTMAAAEPAKAPEPAAAPAAAAEPEKKAEAPAAPAPAETPAKTADAAPAADAGATKTADAAKPADAAAPAAAPAADAAKPADAAAAPAGDIKDRTSPPDPVSELAKSQGVKFEDGRYRNKDGDPQPVITKDYMVDWGTWNGFRRYHDACHVCHGPNAGGSTFAPALAESLKTIDYNTFVATVSSGKRENKGGTEFVMPSFGTDKNIMCYLDDIYTYIKARSNYSASGGKEGMPPGRPNGREDITDEAKKAADDCTG